MSNANGKLIGLVRAAFVLFASAVSIFAQSRNPVIFVPGLTGSELRDRTTKEKVWVKAFRSSKSEDLRLPISPDITKIGDNLVPGDIVRGVDLAGVQVRDIYGGFVKAMATSGYHEERWDAPSERGFENSLYVFAYDWRLDNVANARLLIRSIEKLKAKLGKPDLKFDLVGHSMGGIISRYAAMYGDADLPEGKPVPTWRGAAHIDQVILLGVPNEGSVAALDALINGYKFGGLRIDLPFLQDSSRYMVFTIPAAYQLLPAPGTLRAFDDRLEPVDIDIYDAKVWSKYGWNPIDDDEFPVQFKLAERRVAPEYFAAMLLRARRLHDALAARSSKPGVLFYTVGSNCTSAPDGIVVYRDGQTGKWQTLFRPKGFVRSDGQRITDAELKQLMVGVGDGVVTIRSEESKTQSEMAKVPSVLNAEPGTYFCEEHSRLASDSRIQDHIIKLLDGRLTKTLAEKQER